MNLNQVFEQFNNLKVLVIGDVMIDSYLWGRVDRISPEAPVPIISVQKREKRLGGAANVLLNVKSLGATPIICSVIGKDADGNDFLNILDQEGFSKEGIVQSEFRPTTIKHRIIAKTQHMLRIDAESEDLLNTTENDEFLAKIQSLLHDIDVVILEDYDKGVLTPQNIPTIIAWCNERNIPVTVDPKKKNFMNFNGVTLFKTNLLELKQGLNIEVNPKINEDIKKGIALLKEKVPHQNTLITLSEYGMFYDTDQFSEKIPAHRREISDVSGAGDTVISVASLCVALQLPDNMVVELANLAGGLVCESVGVVPIDKDRLLQEALELDI